MVLCVDWCRFLAILFFVPLLALHILADDSDNFNCAVGLGTAGATIPKGDIILEHGKSLEIFCNLNISHKEAQGRNSSNLVFYRNDKKVPSEFITIINETTIRLYKKKPPASTIYYYCKLELLHNVTGICLNMVAIGYKPKEVENFSCVSQNWQNLTCRWTKPENPVKTTYKLLFYLPGRAGKRIIYGCPTPDDTVATMKAALPKNEDLCFWGQHTDPPYRLPYEYYYFEMRGYNSLGNATFGPMKFHHYANVIPSPPENLTCVNISTNSAFLTWKLVIPMSTLPPGVQHRIEYMSTNDPDQWMEANTSSIPLYIQDSDIRQYHLTGLQHANTYYEVRVYLRSAVAVGMDKWSRYSSITFKTHPTIPSSPPETVIGSFEVVPDGLTREIYVYWKQIPKTSHNGDNFHYKIISVQENGHERDKEYNRSNSYAKFKSLSFNSYKFTIVSTNNIGDSIQNSTVIVPSSRNMPKEPVSFTKIAFHDGIYELSWKSPSESPDIESYTIFWCQNERDRPYQCTGLLDWIVVPASVTMKNITVPHDKIYQFAIAANTHNASSGMVWASCTVIHNKGIGKMKSVWITNVGSTFIEVSWKLECSDRIGRVEGFQIDYCPIVSPHETTCKEPLRSQKLESLERQFNGNVTGLRPYTTYMVSVAILTNNGKGTSSDPLFNTTLEGAPDVPRNVSIASVTNSSVLVNWLPPAALNGVIRYYRVHFNEHHEKCETSNCTTLNITGLQSFTAYNISVVACTVYCSQHSVPVLVTTHIGSPGMLDPPKAEFVNSSLLILRWKRPLKRTGRLDYYQVQSIQTYGDKNNTSNVLNVTNITCQIPVPECNKEDPRFKYKFMVRAVNIAEDNQELYGPWSEAEETHCFPKDGVAMRITLYVVGSIMITCFFIVMAYMGKKVWRRCKEMQQVEVKLPPGLAPAGEKEKGQDFPIDVTWSSGSHDHHITGKIRPSADEELLLKKKKEERHGRNASGDSSGCSSGHESVSSSLTSGTQISSDSGTEVDQRPPSPDGVFEETPPWDHRNSLRLRKASNSVVRSTPILTDIEGANPSQQFCMGPWSSTGYISMPSSEEIAGGSGGGCGSIVGSNSSSSNSSTSNSSGSGNGGEGTSYCRVGLEASSIMANTPQQVQGQSSQIPAVKGYVVLPSMASVSSPSNSSSPQIRLPSPSTDSGTRGYVSHQFPWASPKESPNKGYVMAGELGDIASNKPSPTSLLVMELDDDHSIVDFDTLDRNAQTPESYCRFGLCSAQSGEASGGTENVMTKSNSGYVTLGETSNLPDANPGRGNRVGRVDGSETAGGIREGGSGGVAATSTAGAVGVTGVTRATGMAAATASVTGPATGIGGDNNNTSSNNTTGGSGGSSGEEDRGRGEGAVGGGGGGTGATAATAGAGGGATLYGQRSVGTTGGYVPHRHFEKRNTLPLSSSSSSYQDQADDSYTKMFPTNTGESKPPTMNI